MTSNGENCSILRQSPNVNLLGEGGSRAWKKIFSSNYGSVNV